MVTVALEARGREDLGEPVQELESRETKSGAADEVGPREQVENLIGPAADEVEAVESERGPRTIADQPFPAGSVGAFDAHAGVETEPAAVISGKHVLDLAGLREAVAANVAQDPLSHGVLEALKELRRDRRRFVEVETGFWIPTPITRDVLEEAIDHAEVWTPAWSAAPSRNRRPLRMIDQIPTTGVDSKCPPLGCGPTIPLPPASRNDDPSCTLSETVGIFDMTL